MVTGSKVTPTKCCGVLGVDPSPCPAPTVSPVFPVVHRLGEDSSLHQQCTPLCTGRTPLDAPRDQHPPNREPTGSEPETNSSAGLRHSFLVHEPSTHTTVGATIPLKRLCSSPYDHSAGGNAGTPCSSRSTTQGAARRQGQNSNTHVMVGVQPLIASRLQPGLKTA